MIKPETDLAAAGGAMKVQAAEFGGSAEMNQEPIPGEVWGKGISPGAEGGGTEKKKAEEGNGKGEAEDGGGVGQRKGGGGEEGSQGGDQVEGGVGGGGGGRGGR